MILKRPFAFLIKHFKLIHLILCLPVFYLLYRSSLILNFITEYQKTSINVVGTDLVTNLFDIKMIISIIVIFIGTIVVVSLMTFKKKPVTFYFYNLLTYLFVIGIYMFDYSIIKTMETALVDIRTIKIVQDLTFSLIIVQTLSAILFAIRATGFDIKKFDFRHDLEDLQISSEDSEEIEIESQFDSDEFRRKIKKFQRHAKYVYVENKLIINLAIILVIGIIAYFIYNNSGIYSKSYKLSVAINTQEFIFNVKNNYQTNEGYRGNIITDKSLIVVDFDVKSNNENKKLDLSRFTLEIDNKKYKPVDKYTNYLKDLGNVYNDQEISTEFINYLLVFEIPVEVQESKKVLKYNDLNNKIVKIKLNPINIDKSSEYENYNSGEKIILNDTIFNGSEIVLGNFEIKNAFKLEYDFCLDSECYKSYEYLKPTYTDNYRKSLLKVTTSLNIEDNFKNSNVDSIKEIITTFGNITYVLNGEEKRTNITTIVKPEIANIGNDIYIEINSEIEQASSITLNLNVRNKQYSYIIK